MIKYIFALLITFSLNSIDLREDYNKAIEGYFGKYELIGSLKQSIYNADILLAKYDIEFKDGHGSSKDGEFLAMVDSNYDIKIYKKVKNKTL